MPSVNLYLDTRTSNKDGEHPVKILVNYAGKQRMFSFGEFMSLERYHGLFTSLKHADKQKCRDLQKKLTKAEAILENLGTSFNWDTFKMYFTSEMEIVTKGSLLYLTDLYEAGKVGLGYKSKVSYDTSLKSLKKFGGEKLTLQDMTKEFLTKYRSWLLEKGCSIATVATYLRPLKVIYNKAVATKRIAADMNPFALGGIKVGCSISAKSALTEAQLKSFWNYKCQTEAQEKAKLYWFFAAFGNGIAPVDIAHLRWTDIKGEYIVFVRQKTRRTSKDAQPVYIVITPQIQDIINKLGSPKGYYIFPIIRKEMKEDDRYEAIDTWKRLTNRTLNRLAKHIDKTMTLNLYAARHTYVNIQMISGTPVAHISKNVGHSNVRTTEHYIGTLPVMTAKQYATVLPDLLKEDKSHLQAV